MCVVESSDFETHEEGSETIRGQLESVVWSAQVDFPKSKNIQVSSRQINNSFWQSLKISLWKWTGMKSIDWKDFHKEFAKWLLGTNITRYYYYDDDDVFEIYIRFYRKAQSIGIAYLFIL